MTENRIEQAKQLVLAEYPDIAITWAIDMSHRLGSLFPSGAWCVMVTTATTAWHVFGYQGKHVILPEQDMVTTSVGDVKRRLTSKD